MIRKISNRLLKVRQVDVIIEEVVERFLFKGIND